MPATPASTRTASTPTRPTARSTASARIAASAASSPTTIKDDQHRRASRARDGPANHNRLCVKGRFGFDYVHHPDRLTKPLIRKAGVPKHDDRDRPGQPARRISARRPGRRRSTAPPRACDASATATAARRWPASARPRARTRRPTCSRSWCAPASARNNVDHCTRLCHASSVAALMEGIGSGAVTAPFTDAADAEVIIVIGANPTENHPVAATFIKNAAKRGAQADRHGPARPALGAPRDARCCSSSPGSDVALLNALMHAIIEEGLYDRQYVQAHTEGFEELREHVARLQRRRRWRRSAASTPRRCARSRGSMPAPSASMIFWGMGISQHVHGTDNARCLIALALVTGQVGRPGTGLHPLRGQNNVQGASDAGLIPMIYPDYQRSRTRTCARKFEALWGTHARPEAGPDRRRDHGRDPCRARSRACTSWARTRRCPTPTSTHAREALAQLEHLVVQDIFLTETRDLRRRGPAGLGLAGEGRHRHQHRPAGAARPRRR